MKTFEEIGVSADIIRAIEELGYKNPMPVQEEVIPYLLGTGNDVIALAQTGTGKTAAYGVPLLQKIRSNDRSTQAVILSPTRELCLQIANDLNDYSKYLDGVYVVPVYGGSSIDSQIKSLRRGAQIIVATPGRLIDLMKRKVAKLDTVENIVFDEADEMLNMGFSDSINEILSGIPKERNTLLFSATMSKEIEKIARKYLHDYKEIQIGSRNEGAENVDHTYYLVQAKDKYKALKRIVDFYPEIYGIIFCRTRIDTKEIAAKLINDGYNAEPLHGELSQAQRDVTMQKFRQHQVQLLVATDVAARGLDVTDLTHVINYGLPDEIESYTHRSGRTGRAGKQGSSISIIHIREKSKIRIIERMISKKFVVGTLPEPKEICTKQLYKAISDLEKVKVDEKQIAPFLSESFRKLEWLSKEDLIKRLLSMEFGRFLDYYANAPAISVPTGRERSEGRNESRRDSGSRERRSDSQPRSAESGYSRLFLNVGKRDGIFAREIISLINRHVPGNIEIGRIDPIQNCSFFEVKEGDASKVVKALSDIDLKGRKVIADFAEAAPSSSRGSSSSRGRDSARSNGGRNFERKDRRSSSPRSSARSRPISRPGKTDEDTGDWRKFFKSENKD